MRVFIGIAVVLCTLYLVHGQKHECKTSGDCADGECCIYRRPGNLCKKLETLGQTCFPVLSEYLDEEIYLRVCPCIAGLKCETDETVEHEREKIVIYHNATCREP